MADNTKIWPIFRWANWGLSDDLFTGIRNSFYSSNDMEIREDAKSIYPKKVPAYADENWFDIGTWVSWEHTVKNVTYSSKDWGWLILLDKKVYLLANNNTITALCTFTETLCDLEMFNGYIYITTTSHLYYKRDNIWNWQDMADSTDASATSYWRCTTSLTSNATHPLYASDVCLCVWDTNKVWKVIREVPNILQTGFELQEWYFIRFINELWWYVRVVAVDEPYWSEVLLWDKISDAPVEVIPLEWYTVLWSAIFWGYHYLLTNKWLGLLNWYQYYLLKKASWDVDTEVRNCMCVYDDKLYFVTTDKVYIYWAKNKNYADVLNVWHNVEDWFKLWAIGSYKSWIMITRNYKYVSGGDNSPVRVWVNGWYAQTWEVQTMCYYGTSMSEIKQSAYLRIGYHIPTITNSWWSYSGNLKVSYRTEADATTDNPEDWEWHMITDARWLRESSDMRSPFATTLKLNCRFQWIQFKFELTNCVVDDWESVTTKDTNLYSADLYYNVMLD